MTSYSMMSKENEHRGEYEIRTSNEVTKKMKEKMDSWIDRRSKINLQAHQRIYLFIPLIFLHLLYNYNLQIAAINHRKTTMFCKQRGKYTAPQEELYWSEQKIGKDEDGFLSFLTIFFKEHLI